MESKKMHENAKTFYDLTPQESKGLSEIVFKNARQLWKDALLITKNNKSHSSANSLLILSSEEVIKAILILLHCQQYNVYKIKDARKFFFDHKIRHQLAQLIEITVGIFESIDKINSPKEVKLFNIKNEFWNTFVNGVVEIANAAKPLLKSSKRVKDLEEFNNNKNDGLYVGFKDEISVPSKMINETSFNQTKEIVDRIFRVYKILKIIYHPSIHHRKLQEEIDRIKNQLRILIDEGMEGFSLKELNFRWKKN